MYHTTHTAVGAPIVITIKQSLTTSGTLTRRASFSPYLSNTIKLINKYLRHSFRSFPISFFT